MSTDNPINIHHQRQEPTKTLHPILAEGLPLLFLLTNDSNDVNIGEVLIKGENHKGGILNYSMTVHIRFTK